MRRGRVFPGGNAPVLGPGGEKLRLRRRGRRLGASGVRESWWNEGDGIVGEPELIRRASAGDAEAAGMLWQSSRRWVAAVLLAHKPREADLEDLLQEVAVAVVEKLGQLDDPSAFKGWLRSVAVNTARATGRKTTRRRGLLRLVRSGAGQAIESTPAAGAWVDPSGLERAERSRRLAELVHDLPEAYRECVLLRCVRGMSHAQIAEVTGLPETTVETRIARGRRALRELAQDSETTPSTQAVMP